METKTCIKCGEGKAHEDFYKHPRMADGRLGKCKVCCGSDEKANRAAHPERRAAYERKRNANPGRRSNRLRYQTTGRARYPERFRARARVQYALRVGKLKRQPCEQCGTASAHAHHDDYSKPLEVRWLCPLHHRRLHLEHTPS